MIEYLLQLDQQLLIWVNSLTGNSAIDAAMVFVSKKFVWIPLYAFLLYRIYVKLGSKNTLWVLLGAFVTLTLTDLGSVQLFKDVFQRLRPCHNPELSELLYLPSGKCGGKFGFISSHASNVFGLASFLFIMLGDGSRVKLVALLWLWAAVVSFSRVYLAAHYPLDILIGAFFGVFIGLSMGGITKRQLSFTPA